MYEIDNQKFGGFVAALRKEKGYTQKELAEKLFLSDKAISKWERGLSLLDIALLEPLADILGVTVAELLKGERIHAALEPQEMDELLGKNHSFVRQSKTRTFWFSQNVVFVCPGIQHIGIRNFNMAGCKSDPEGHLCFRSFICLIWCMVLLICKRTASDLL